MGVLPLEFLPGEGAEALGLDGTESFDLTRIADGLAPRGTVRVKATRRDGMEVSFDVKVRIDTAGELDYYKNGGILQYVLRQLLKS